MPFMTICSCILVIYNDNNMTFVGSYCLFVPLAVTFAANNNMPSKSRVIALL